MGSVVGRLAQSESLRRNGMIINNMEVLGAALAIVSWCVAVAGAHRFALMDGVEPGVSWALATLLSSMPIGWPAFF
jgi:hypothetical protein